MEETFSEDEGEFFFQRYEENCPLPSFLLIFFNDVSSKLMWLEANSSNKIRTGIFLKTAEYIPSP